MLKVFFFIFFFIHNIHADNLDYVKICVDPDWMPMERIDNNGKHIGIVADTLALIEKKTNFKFVLIPTKDWSQSVLFLQQKKCDVLPLVSKTEDRKKYTSFTIPYIDYPEVLVTRIHEDKKSLEEVLKLPIGLTKGYAAIEWFKKHYPSIDIVEVENINDAFMKLRNEEIYSYSDTLPIVGYKLQEEGILDLKISHFIEDFRLNAGMGVRKDKTKLYEKLNQTIRNLKEDELNIISKKWIKINIEDIIVRYNYKVIIFTFFIILIIFLIVLYWNHKLNSLVKIKTKEIQEFANTLEGKVQERTKKVNHLLNNAGQGFLTLSKDFLIDDEYSKECESMLGTNISYQDISKLFFINKSEANNFKLNLDTVLNIQDKNARLYAITLLPKEVIINSKTIKTEYKIIDGKFMLILTDISENKKLEEGIKDEKNILKMTISVIKDNDIFIEIKDNFYDFISNIDDYINQDKPALHNINNVYREIHTLKGSFLQLFMNETASHLHNVESELSNILANDKIVTNEYLLQFLKEVNFETFTNVDLDNIVRVLGETFINNNKFISIKKESIKNIEAKCALLIEKYDKNEAIDMLESIRSLSIKSLKSYLDAYSRLLFHMSQGIKTPIYEFEAIGDENILLDNKFINFIQSLIHVFRNSLTHGIESENARELLDKELIGTVFCSFTQENNNLKIIISDDGAGIDVEKIREKANNKNLSKEEAFAYIFQDRFSTREKVDKFSGRGVGLTSVKTEIDKLGGNIEVISEVNVGSKFIFTIPLILYSNQKSL